MDIFTAIQANLHSRAIFFGFSGFAALGTVMLAAVLWVVACMAFSWWLQVHSNGLAPKPGQPPVPIFAELGNLCLRTPSNAPVFGYMPVMFMRFGSALWVFVVSLLTRPPSRRTIEKFFPGSKATLLPFTYPHSHHPKPGSQL